MSISGRVEAKVELMLEEARTRGEEAGERAARWAVDDGRWSSRDTADMRERYQEDPDAFVERFMESVNWPSWLSGEWAGESIGEILGDVYDELEELVEDHGLTDDEEQDVKADIATAYEESADLAFQEEIERQLARALGED